MYKSLFNLIAGGLTYLSKITGLSYNQINVIVYYFIIPFTWIWGIDILYGFKYPELFYLVFCTGILVGCEDFSLYCDQLFTKSVNFLLYFQKFGLNYHKASIWICIGVPLIISIILIVLIYQKH